MARRPAPAPIRTPRRGHAVVRISVVDENGFVHDYAPVEAPLGAVRDAVAILHLQRPEEAGDTGSVSATAG